jgi:hypothetical protein
MTVFVSHSRKDVVLPEFELLLNDLNLMRQQVWFDQRLTGGQAWWDEILTQIRACDLFLVVLTKKWRKSEACRRELSYAAAVRRPILPVRITDLSNWELPELLTRTQIVDYSRRAEPGNGSVTFAFALRDAVDQLIVTGGHALPDPLPAPPEVPPSYLSELQPLLEAKELPLAKQEQFIQEVRSHLDDEDEDRKSLLEALQIFRSRPDIAYRVAVELDQLMLGLSVEEPPAESGNGARPDRLEASGVQAAPATPDPVERQPFEPASNGDHGVGTERLNLANGSVKITRYRAPDVDVMKLGQSLRGWYEAQNLEAQMSPDGPRVIVQCRSRAWARRLGAGAALTVVLSREGDELAVEIGGGKWMDKVAVAGVAWFIAWPALIPAAMGGYKQATLPSKTLQYIQSMIPLHTERA